MIMDPDALLENSPGWTLTRIKDELQKEDSWQRLVTFLEKPEAGRRFRLSSQTARFIHSSQSPRDAVIDELLKKCITVSELCEMLQKAQLTTLSELLKPEEPAEIISQSHSGIFKTEVGCPIKFCIEVKGIPVPSTIWYKGDTPMDSSKNRRFLEIDSVEKEDEGIYLCLVQQKCRNTVKNLWSSPVEIVILQAIPSIISQPKELVEVFEDDEVKLSCSAIGHPKPMYQWFMKDEAVSGMSEENSFKILCASTCDAGLYYCEVSNSVGKVTSLTTKLVVTSRPQLEPPVIIRQPVLEDSIAERSIGQTVSLFVTARSLLNVQFQWHVNGRQLEGTSSSLHLIMESTVTPMYSSALLYSISTADERLVRICCLVKSPGGEVLSEQVTVKVVSSTKPRFLYAGMKWALLIANQDYHPSTFKSLHTPCRDLQLVAKDLVDMGFRCLLFNNLSLVEIKNVIHLMDRLIRPQDYVLFFYAGHGLYNGSDHLLPINSSVDSTLVTTLSVSWAKAQLQKNKPSLLFMVLDMCRAIHLTECAAPVQYSSSSALRNSVVLHATTEGLQALEDPRSSSILIESLLKHLKDKDHITKIASETMREVAHKSRFVRKVQVPKLDIDLCEERSLWDPSPVTCQETADLFDHIMMMPSSRSCQISLPGQTIQVFVKLSHGGEFSLTCNVLKVEVYLESEKQLPDMSLHISTVGNQQEGVCLNEELNNDSESLENEVSQSSEVDTNQETLSLNRFNDATGHERAEKLNSDSINLENEVSQSSEVDTNQETLSLNRFNDDTEYKRAEKLNSDSENLEDKVSQSSKIVISDETLNLNRFNDDTGHERAEKLNSDSESLGDKVSQSSKIVISDETLNLNRFDENADDEGSSSDKSINRSQGTVFEAVFCQFTKSKDKLVYEIKDIQQLSAPMCLYMIAQKNEIKSSEVLSIGVPNIGRLGLSNDEFDATTVKINSTLYNIKE